jgi:hypothetical protein
MKELASKNLNYKPVSTPRTFFPQSEIIYPAAEIINPFDENIDFRNKIDDFRFFVAVPKPKDTRLYP